MRNNYYIKQQKAADREAKLKMDLHGDGVYLFENNTSGDLLLPKPANNGRRSVAHKGQFQGDSYFMKMVKTNELKLIKTIVPIVPAVKTSTIVESGDKKMLNENKLILDQPEKFTSEGHVEHVSVSKDPKKQKLNESKPSKNEKEKEKDTLITEDPMSGVEIILN